MTASRARATGLAAALAAALLLPAGAVAAAGPETLVVRQEPFEVAVHDLGGDGIGPGDLYTWVAPVTADDGRAGTNIGVHEVVHMPTEGPYAEVRIGTSVIDLGDGDTIALGGLVPVTEPGAEVTPGTELVNAIVGGTGAFGGAKGEIRSVRAEDGSWTHTLTYRTADLTVPVQTLHSIPQPQESNIADLTRDGATGAGDFRTSHSVTSLDDGSALEVHTGYVLARGPGDDGSAGLAIGASVATIAGDLVVALGVPSISVATGQLVQTSNAIAGGTGRFAGARGSWAAERREDGTIVRTFEFHAPPSDAVERTLVMRSALPAAGTIDLGDPGESFGDQFTFSLPFTGDDESGTAYGYGSTVIPAADGSPVRTVIGLISVQLDDGSTILVADLHTDDTAIPRAEDAAVTRPVVGGTGRYAGVSGELVTTLDGHGGLVHTFHLVGPAA